MGEELMAQTKPSCEWTSLFTTNGRRNNRRKLNRNSKRTNSDVT